MMAVEVFASCESCTYGSLHKAIYIQALTWYTSCAYIDVSVQTLGPISAFFGKAIQHLHPAHL